MVICDSSPVMAHCQENVVISATAKTILCTNNEFMPDYDLITSRSDNPTTY